VRYKPKGRPNKYPFADLLPGDSLCIPIVDESDCVNVRSALFQFKKYNNLDWNTSVFVDGKTIYVNRF